MNEKKLSKIVEKWKDEPGKPVRIIGLGSDNTELHWHSLGHFNWLNWLNSSLQESVGRHITVINQGVAGNTIADMSNRLERDIFAYDPTMVIITVGEIDADRGLRIKKFRRMLETLVKKCIVHEIIPVLQTYYCPLYEEMGRDFQRLPQFMQVVRFVAKKYHIPLIDQYSYFEPFYRSNRPVYKEIMSDALHVNEVGNALLGILICRTFQIRDPRFYQNIHALYNHIKLMERYCEIPGFTS